MRNLFLTATVAAFVMTAAPAAFAQVSTHDLKSASKTEDVTKADDRHAIDEGYDIYRGLLASMLKSIWRGYDGERKLDGLSQAQARHAAES